MRKLYKVRIRVQVSPNKWVKKTRFYWEKSPGDAAAKYKGPGNIMWVEKMSEEKMKGVGEFFGLGNQLLREFKRGGVALEENVEAVEREKSRHKKQQRRFHAKQRKQATY